MLRQRTNARRGERGSVVIAISALMLLLLIGTALIARSQAELSAVAAGADAEAAQAGAEQGVAEVLALLDAGETGSFSGDGEVGEGKYAYKAEKVSDTEYLVRAEGYVGDRVRAVEVTIVGGSAAPAGYTLAINHRAVFDNNRGLITGRVATNGPLDVRGAAPGDVVDLHGRDAECGACRVTNTFPDRLEMPDPQMPSGVTRRCPSDGRFTGRIDGQGGVPYVCTPANMRANTVRFVSTVSVVNPPLIIYVREGLDVLIINASVNADGEPDDFQLSAEGDRSVYWWYDIWNSRVHGVLYAPNRDWIVGSADVYGSAATGVLYIQEPDDVWMTPFGSTASASGWTVTSWEQVPGS